MLSAGVFQVSSRSPWSGLPAAVLPFSESKGMARFRFRKKSRFNFEQSLSRTAFKFPALRFPEFKSAVKDFATRWMAGISLRNVPREHPGHFCSRRCEFPVGREHLLWFCSRRHRSFLLRERLALFCSRWHLKLLRREHSAPFCSRRRRNFRRRERLLSFCSRWHWNFLCREHLAPFCSRRLPFNIGEADTVGSGVAAMHLAINALSIFLAIKRKWENCQMVDYQAIEASQLPGDIHCRLGGSIRDVFAPDDIGNSCSGSVWHPFAPAGIGISCAGSIWRPFAPAGIGISCAGSVWHPFAPADCHSTLVRRIPSVQAWRLCAWLSAHYAFSWH